LRGRHGDTADAMGIALHEHFDNDAPLIAGAEHGVDRRQVISERDIHDAAAHGRHDSHIRCCGFVFQFPPVGLWSETVRHRLRPEGRQPRQVVAHGRRRRSSPYCHATGRSSGTPGTNATQFLYQGFVFIDPASGPFLSTLTSDRNTWYSSANAEPFQIDIRAFKQRPPKKLRFPCMAGGDPTGFAFSSPFRQRIRLDCARAREAATDAVEVY
jgi:hypothetical protein